MKARRMLLILSILSLFSCKDVGKEISGGMEEQPKDSVVLPEPAHQGNTKEKSELPIPQPTDCGLSFEEFFERFSKDSLFQKSRIKYPLKDLYYKDTVDDELTTEYVSYTSYRFKNFIDDKNAMQNEYNRYKVEIEKLNNKVFYRHLGYDNGIRRTYMFEIIDGCWLLVEILDEST